MRKMSSPGNRAAAYLAQSRQSKRSLAPKVMYFPWLSPWERW